MANSAHIRQPRPDYSLSQYHFQNESARIALLDFDFARGVWGWGWSVHGVLRVTG